MNRILRWAAAPLAVAALAGTTLLPAASASAATGATAMTTYTIELISLTCNKKQDVDKDEPELFIDGVSKFGPGSMKKGDTAILTGRSATFTGTATMELFEVDNGQDDFLGSAQVTSAQADGNVHVATFDFRNHAKYTLLYEVTS
ncbi:hypothetical protein [Microbispora sp. H10885]|uniref:hypothetical protein n=1 Tax=Microbispora sp. H10885 TaxID=2729110 RepID=UPI001601AAFE|nr:hypothetical protein [Microbispora sp. H10885]